MKNNDDIAIVVQARLNSQRLPNKMLKPFVNTTLFNLLLDKLNNSSLIDNKKVYLSIYEDELKQASAGYGFNIYNRSYQSANEDNDIRVIYEWYKDIKEKYVVLISACNPLLKIETIENRAVIFNSQIPHGGSTTSNADNRVVLNINIHTNS